LLGEQTALRIEDWMQTRLAVLRAVRGLAIAGQLDDAAVWTKQIAALSDGVGGYQAINWLDAEGRVVWIAPTEGNEAALGRLVTDHAVAAPAYRDAIAHNDVRASAPLDLFQGGRAVTAYLPVLGPRGLVGVVNGVFRSEALFDQCLADLSVTHDVALTDGDVSVLTSSAAVAPTALTQRFSLAVDGRTWVLSLTPHAPPIAWLQAIWTLVVVLVLMAGLSTAMWSAWRSAEVAQAAVRDRERMAGRLVRSERMEAMGRLAGGIAHDFNNVLTVVSGNAEMLELRLETGPVSPDVVRRHAGRIRDAALRAAKLTGQLLAFARRAPDEDGVVDLVAHVSGLSAMLRNLATERSVVHIQAQGGPLWVSASEGVMDRVLINLVSNARDAIGEGTGRIDIAVVPHDGGAVVTVKDNGRGMAPEVQAHIFEPFYTTKDMGNGLGLATVYGLVTHRGGRIEVSSVPERGTTFTVWFPSTVVPVKEPTAARSVRSLATGVRVALVEDQDDVRDVMRVALTAAGLVVDAYPDAQSALAETKEVDVLVTDLVLPGPGGMALAMGLRARVPDLGVVVVSGYMTDEVTQAALVDAGARVVPKPFHLRDLVEAIRAVAPVQPKSERSPP